MGRTPHVVIDPLRDAHGTIHRLNVQFSPSWTTQDGGPTGNQRAPHVGTASNEPVNWLVSECFLERTASLLPFSKKRGQQGVIGMATALESKGYEKLTPAVASTLLKSLESKRPVSQKNSS